MSLQCIFNRFSVYVDAVSNKNFDRFWIQTLSVCRAITFLITELIMFSLALPPVVSVSIIEPEAPGVLLRFGTCCILFSVFVFVFFQTAEFSAVSGAKPSHHSLQRIDM